jgi:hypothetical protein
VVPQFGIAKVGLVPTEPANMLIFMEINGIDLAKLIYCITNRTRICGGYIMIYHDIFIVTGVYKSSKHDWGAPPCDQRLETAQYFKQVGETIV